jgi:hypothetical protein
LYNLPKAETANLLTSINKEECFSTVVSQRWKHVERMEQGNSMPCELQSFIEKRDIERLARNN